MTGRPFFFVPGKARPQGSKRAPVAGVVRESTKGLHSWRRAVKATAIAAGWSRPADELNWTCALVFVRARPKGHYKRVSAKAQASARVLRDDAPAYPGTKPDIDKLERAILDALTGVCWRDDARVIAVRKWKLFGADQGVAVLVAPAKPIRAGCADLPAANDERARDAALVQVFNWWPAQLAQV